MAWEPVDMAPTFRFWVERETSERLHILSVGRLDLLSIGLSAMASLRRCCLPKNEVAVVKEEVGGLTRIKTSGNRHLRPGARMCPRRNRPSRIAIPSEPPLLRAVESSLSSVTEVPEQSRPESHPTRGGQSAHPLEARFRAVTGRLT